MTKKLHGRCSIKIAALKNFAIFTGKHLYWSLFLIELQEETPTQVFPVNVAKFLRAPILKNICKQLLLKLVLFPFCYLQEHAS